MKSPGQHTMARCVLPMLLLWATAFWGSCAAPVERKAGPGELQRHFPFLKEGSTSLREVRARFGTPTEEFDSGRVLIYRLWLDEQKTLQLLPDPAFAAFGPSPGNGQLILAFASDGVLERARVVFRIPLESSQTPPTRP